MVVLAAVVFCSPEHFFLFSLILRFIFDTTCWGNRLIFFPEYEAFSDYLKQNTSLTKVIVFRLKLKHIGTKILNTKRM